MGEKKSEGKHAAPMPSTLKSFGELLKAGLIRPTRSALPLEAHIQARVVCIRNNSSFFQGPLVVLVRGGGGGEGADPDGSEWEVGSGLWLVEYGREECFP